MHTNYYTRSQNIEARRWPGAAAEASQLLASACQAGGDMPLSTFPFRLSMPLIRGTKRERSKAAFTSHPPPSKLHPNTQPLSTQMNVDSSSDSDMESDVQTCAASHQSEDVMDTTSEDLNSHLWGFLQPCNPTKPQIDFWRLQSCITIGRAPSNQIVFDGSRISESCPPQHS